MKVFHIKDPKLLFHNEEPALDPCHGLTVYGPYGLNNFKTIRVAAIGSSESVLEVENLINRMGQKILHNKSLKWPFPGLGNEKLKFDLEIIRKQIIGDAQLDVFKDTSAEKRVERIKHALRLIETKISNISDIEPKPDVIIISIPKIILKSCRDSRFRYTTRIFLTNKQFDNRTDDYKEGYNFHNIIKIYGMIYQIPTQLIYPYTVESNPAAKGRQDLATIAWNLAVALLYKANEIPWKYFKFPDSTCFIGISFHREFDVNDELVMRAGVAQTFLSDGRDIVLRGERFHWDDSVSRSPHMTKEYAKKLMAEILEKYGEHWGGNTPNRVVIHKTSEYWKEERIGLEEGLTDINKVDLVSVSNTDIKFFRFGQEPVVRGTFIEFLGRTYLYNVGYTPCLNVYPGARIPTPLEVKFFRTDEDKLKICQEILALARMNWNNIDYSTREPVTLTFSRNVGKILSEYLARSFNNPPDKYKYYM